ncbi:MAG: hypothetical protein RI957_1904 [Verrucomicrobiota bacterium]|jgi:hypothetical protein
MCCFSLYHFTHCRTQYCYWYATSHDVKGFGYRFRLDFVSVMRYVF